MKARGGNHVSKPGEESHVQSVIIRYNFSEWQSHEDAMHYRHNCCLQRNYIHSAEREKE